MPVNIVGSEAGAKAMLLKQLNSLFFISKIEEAAIDGEFGRALARCQRSFSKTRNKYYSEASATKFDPLQGCQWSRFLYELARCIFVEEGVSSVCDKLYALNKAMSSVDLYYQVAMPDIFMFDHPFGSVMGRASYSDYFTFSRMHGREQPGHLSSVWPIGFHVFEQQGHRRLRNRRQRDHRRKRLREGYGHPWRFSRFRAKPGSGDQRE